MFRYRLVFLFGLSIILIVNNSFGQIYSIQTSTIEFVSEAPLEVIRAASTEAKGLIDFGKSSFAITVGLKTFLGFNSPLQQEHFNENYVESDIYSNSVFKGKIIEPVNVSQIGETNVRAKGILEIHGKSKEHIIPVAFSINDQMIILNAVFNIELSDYNISIPRIVENKISETIQITVYAELVPFKSIEN